MQDKLTTARNAGKLKPYDLTQAKVGDKVDPPLHDPVRKGDVLYSPRGAVIKRVVSHVEPYESYDKEDNPVTTLRVYGDDDLWDKPEKLTWTKPKPHIVINGFNVPEPVREPLSEGTMYYVPHLFSGKADFYSWAGDDVDHHFLRSGLVHLTEEAATAHAQALISLTKS